MKKYYIPFITLLFSISLLSCSQQKSNDENPDYKNPSKSTNERVADLLGRMTLEEKAAQLQSVWEYKAKLTADSGTFDFAKFEKELPNGLGHWARVNEGTVPITGSTPPRLTVKMGNEIQRYFVEKTRLGIPVLFHEESLHGNQAQDATNFPVPLALGCSFNPQLMSDMYAAIAKEVRARGGHQVLAPVADIARDPRWGRTEECFGEDPYLVSKMIVAVVNAYQGNSKDGSIGRDNVASTLKHFGIHGEPEGGVNIGPSTVDERTAREIFFPAFKAGVQAGATSIMPTYNEWQGIPAHSNDWLLNDLLRKEWGFKGVVVSDYYAINELRTLHRQVALNDTAGAAALALTSGVDIELPDRLAYLKLPQLVKDKKLKEAVLDTAVARILRLKFRLGLFENPYANEESVEQVVGSPAHRELALQAARESMVLLKNDNATLPFNTQTINKLAVIGPNANRTILGGYSHTPKNEVSPLAGIKDIAQGLTITYAEGVRLTDEGNWFSEDVATKLASPESNRERIKEAVAAAAGADAVVLFLGGNEAISREAWSKTHTGDHPDLTLKGLQDELVNAIAALGKPTAAFIIAGQPFDLRNVHAKVPAIVNCFYLGQEGGTAMAEVLFGNYNPSGKLSISFPRSAGHIPAFYNYKPTARRGYYKDSVNALYTFGHGLSYTTFGYSEPVLTKATLPNNKLEPVEIKVTVTNTGNLPGTEIVQAYISHQNSSITRPVMELKAFGRVALQPGESKEVTLSIPPDGLKYYNRQMKFVAEPHTLTIMVGGNPKQLKTTTLKLE